MLPPRDFDIMLDHHIYERGERNSRLPGEHFARLARIAEKHINLSRPEIPLIDLDVSPPVQASSREGELDDVAHTVRLPRGNDIVIGVLLLQHQPHRLDIVGSKTPIAPRFEVSEVELVLQSLTDPADGPSYFPRYEGLAATGALMIE
jgi:hypothetical protein